MNQQAFILRITPSRTDRVPEALSENQIIIGWANAKGLLHPNLTWKQFREIIRQKYYSATASVPQFQQVDRYRSRSGVARNR